MFNLNKINIKELLKKAGLSANQLDFETSFRNGKYHGVYSEEELIVYLGSKTKSKKIAYVETKSTKSNKTLKDLGCDFFIGEKIDTSILLENGFIVDDLFWVKKDESKTLILELNKDCIKYLALINTDVTLENSNEYGLWKKSQKFQEIANCDQVKAALIGVWIYSEKETFKNLTEPCHFEEVKIWDFQSDGKSIFYNSYGEIELQRFKRIQSKDVNSLTIDEQGLLQKFQNSKVYNLSVNNEKDIEVVEGDDYSDVWFYKISKIYKNNTFSIKVFTVDRVSNYKFSISDERLALDFQQWIDGKTVKFKVIYLKADKTKVWPN